MTAIPLLNWMTRVRRPRCPPEAVLLLLPRCLQNSRCDQKLTRAIDQCEGCGKCKIAAILKLRDRCGFRVAVAAGGRQALRLAKQAHIKGVIAVACEKELSEGLRALFPKPVIGVSNRLPNGPCEDTDVMIQDVEKALACIIR